MSLNDPSGPQSLHIGSQEVHFTGFGRSKAGFTAQAWKLAWQHPKVVVALHPNLAPVAMQMRVPSPQTRTIVFAHGVEVWEPLNKLRRWSLAHTDLVLAPSSDTVSHLVQVQRVDSGRTGCLPWSLGPEFDPEATSARSQSSGPGLPEGRIVLAVGRWDANEAYKGVDHLIAAMSQVVREVPEAHLVAIGEGSDLDRLRRLAQDSGVAARIHFLPFLPADQLETAYQRCDVFALPSRGEGFGLVFLEAMSHGKPVIGGAHGGTTDVIEDGVYGYLVSHGDVNALSERLASLLADEPLRCRMGEAARQRVLRDYTFERFSRELAARLETLSAES